MQYGADAAGIAKQSRLTGRPIPPDVRVALALDLRDVLRPFLALYEELHDRREWGAGMTVIPQPIKASETLILARFFGFDRRVALRFIGAMDRTFRAEFGRKGDTGGE